MDVRSRLALTGLLTGLMLAVTLLFSPFGQPRHDLYDPSDGSPIVRSGTPCANAVSTLADERRRRVGAWEMVALIAVGDRHWSSGPICPFAAYRAVKFGVISIVAGALMGLVAARAAPLGQPRRWTPNRA